MNDKKNDLHERVAKQFRMTFQLGSCDPDNCGLCDCGMDDEGRRQIHDLADQQATEVIGWVQKAMTLKDAKRFFQLSDARAHTRCWRVRKEYLDG